VTLQRCYGLLTPTATSHRGSEGRRSDVCRDARTGCWQNSSAPHCRKPDRDYLKLFVESRLAMGVSPKTIRFYRERLSKFVAQVDYPRASRQQRREISELNSTQSIWPWKQTRILPGHQGFLSLAERRTRHSGPNEEHDSTHAGQADSAFPEQRPS
jgi:hypothetical protein